jgi:hypothetical protein
MEEDQLATVGERGAKDQLIGVVEAARLLDTVTKAESVDGDAIDQLSLTGYLANRRSIAEVQPAFWPAALRVGDRGREGDVIQIVDHLDEIEVSEDAIMIGRRVAGADDFGQRISIAKEDSIGRGVGFRDAAEQCFKGKLTIVVERENMIVLPPIVVDVTGSGGQTLTLVDDYAYSVI